MLGVAFSPYLVTHHPLLLIALSPVGRHLVLAAPNVDPVAFIAVTVLRRLLFFVACFHLGRSLGPWAIPWIEARAARFARVVRVAERLFARAPRLVVLAIAGPSVSALAGVAGMKLGVFAPLAATSLVFRALFYLGFAAWIDEYVALALAWIDRYWVPATLVMVTGVALHQWRRYARRGSRTA
jgi:hypothetical protein